MSSVELVTHSPEQTQALGNRIGQLAQPGDVFLLVGELGAGKTCLTQGITWGLGIEEYAMSPTFVIMRELHGRLPLYHIDLYRLTPEEFFRMGLDEYLNGDGIAVIEWADKIKDYLGQEGIYIELKRVAAKVRELTVCTEREIDVDSWA